MKAAEDYLQEAYEIIVQNKSSEHEDVDPVLLKAFKNYALQEVKKHLEIASEKALIYQHSRDYKVGVKSKIVRQKIMISEVHKESITDIEINLT